LWFRRTEVRARRADHPALFICFFLALPVQYVLIGIAWYGLFSIRAGSDPITAG